MVFFVEILFPVRFFIVFSSKDFDNLNSNIICKTAVTRESPNPTGYNITETRNRPIKISKIAIDVAYFPRSIRTLYIPYPNSILAIPKTTNTIPPKRL